MVVLKILEYGTKCTAASTRKLAAPAFKNPNTYKYVSDLSGTMMPVEPAAQVFKPLVYQLLVGLLTHIRISAAASYNLK